MSPKDLLQLVEATLIARGMTASQFGLEAVGDPNLVGDMRNGREPRWTTSERILKYIRKSERTRAAQ
jgi:predicted transcriptional regulator